MLILIHETGAALQIINSLNISVRGNDFVGNKASNNGGAVHCADVAMAVVDGNIFDDNSAGVVGGGISMLRGENVTIRFNALVNNSAVLGAQTLIISIYIHCQQTHNNCQCNVELGGAIYANNEAFLDEGVSL